MGYDVHIKRLEPCALIELQGTRERIQDWLGDSFPEFPAIPNSAIAQQDLSLYWIAPEKWLLRAPADREDEMLSITRLQLAPVDISIVLVSDSLKFFNIDGPDADQIVAIASPLDIHSSIFPDHGATYTEAFGLKALLMRVPGGFEIAVESSFADMIADYFVRVTAD